MKTARVIITEKCNRECSYCCNKQEGLLASAKPLSEMAAELEEGEFEAICITGGEPMIVPHKIEKFTYFARKALPKALVYMYSAQFTHRTEDMLGMLDGIHFTLHENPSPRDIIDFHKFQEVIAKEEHRNKSFRLYVNPSIDQPLNIVPCLWKRVEIKPFLEECPLPENETLFRWGY